MLGSDRIFSDEKHENLVDYTMTDVQKNCISDFSV